MTGGYASGTGPQKGPVFISLKSNGDFEIISLDPVTKRGIVRLWAQERAASRGN
jgi:hypothetical protein